MEAADQILLGVLLLAIAAFPVAALLYLRTAYREGGWPQVKTAAIVAVVAMLIPVALRIWFDWEFNHLLRTIEHPFALGSILFVALMWLAHRALKGADTGDA
jgi:peptidoglycan biosynthesis protein MviN/MurJ (putative lipid II flippase)